MSGVAGRYGAALFELANESGTADAVSGDLKRFAAFIEESPDLKRLVTSPVFTADQQKAAVGAVLDRAGIGGIVANFIRLVAQKRRLRHGVETILVSKELLPRAKPNGP